MTYNQMFMLSPGQWWPVCMKQDPWRDNMGQQLKGAFWSRLVFVYIIFIFTELFCLYLSLSLKPTGKWLWQKYVENTWVFENAAGGKHSGGNQGGDNQGGGLSRIHSPFLSPNCPSWTVDSLRWGFSILDWFTKKSFLLLPLLGDTICPNLLPLLERKVHFISIVINIKLSQFLFVGQF